MDEPLKPQSGEVVVAPGLPTFKQLSTLALARTKERYQNIFPLLLVPACISLLTGFVSGTQPGTGMWDYLPTFLTSSAGGSAVAAGVGVLGVGTVTVLILGLSQVVNLALMRALGDAQIVEAKTAFMHGLRVFIPSMVIAVLTGVVVVGGVVALVVPGILFALWFMFSPAVLVMEGERGMRALMRSKDIIVGKTQEVFWRLGLLVVVTFVPQAIISGMLGIWAGEASGKTIASLVNSLVFLPFSTAFLMLLFHNLAALKPKEAFLYDSKTARLYVGAAILGALALIALGFYIPSLFQAVPDYQGA